MASIGHQLSHTSPQDLYSMVTQLKRENECLKTDLIRFELMVQIYDKYVKYLRELSESMQSIESIDTNGDNDFIQQINALKDIKNSFVFIENDIKVNELSNSKSFVNKNSEFN